MRSLLQSQWIAVLYYIEPWPGRDRFPGSVKRNIGRRRSGFKASDGVAAIRRALGGSATVNPRQPELGFASQKPGSVLTYILLGPERNWQLGTESSYEQAAQDCS